MITLPVALVTAKLLCLDFTNLRQLECGPGHDSLLISHLVSMVGTGPDPLHQLPQWLCCPRSPAQGQGPAAASLVTD